MTVLGSEYMAPDVGLTGNWADNCIIRSDGDQDNATFQGSSAYITNDGNILAPTFDTNVAAAGLTMSGTTLAADGTDADIDINLTPKGTGALRVAGNSVFQNPTDSTTAYQWLDVNGGTPVMNIDTVNERVGIGTATPAVVLDIQKALCEIKLTDTDAGNSFSVKNNGGNLEILERTTARLYIEAGGNVGIGETAPETLVEMTSTVPYWTSHNSTEEDIEGGRECIWRAKGEKQNGTEHTLGQFQFSHDGTGDDYKADFILSVNQNGGADTLVEAMRIDSAGLMTVTGSLDVTTRISSGTTTLSAAGPTDDLDVSGVNTVFVDTSGGNVTLGGTVGGVDGQILCIVVHDATNNFTIEANEGGGNQDFVLHAGADETMTAEHGGWVFINEGGNHWHDCSHAKHV